MSPLTLLHLTFTGPNKAPASIEFGQHLTVIYGASDTGKSFIVEAIDYMLGASKLKQISEADGYTRILLGLLLADGRTVTLVRSPDDNKVHVLDGDHRRFTSATGRSRSISGTAARLGTISLATCLNSSVLTAATC